jgi:glycosyltransferase 2 family protein
LKARIIKLLKLFVPIAIGVYLTWYFFSGMTDEEIQKTKDAFFEANYLWVALGVFVALLSHLSRAYRWLLLAEPLGFKPRLVNSYHAVMAGYIINYTVPRSGELARAGLLTTYENVPFEKGFATIVIERVIDVMMFGLIFFISGLLQANSEGIRQITESQEQQSNPWMPYIIAGGAALMVLGVVIYVKVERFRKLFNEKMLGFLQGLKSIWTMRKKWVFIFHTFFIWGCYVAGIWMSISCVFAAFVVGSMAIALLPGGIGAYPAWISLVLLNMYDIDFPAYGVFMWVIQTMMLVVLGLLSLFLIQRQPVLNTTRKS